MAGDRHSLKDRTADQIRNEQRGGPVSPADPNRDPGPEGNATQREAWSEPGGEAYSYRQSRTGQTSRAGHDGHDELTAAETPETTRRLSDATLSPKDKDATAEAIARATAVQGEDEGAPDAKAEEAANHPGQDEARTEEREGETVARATPTSHTIQNPGGLANKLQPGGTLPGKSPAASVGSIGTGGGSTAGAPTGNVKKTL